jgi:D-glycero-D-manno-heptose 1,7-bisphosphate phosphatase
MNIRLALLDRDGTLNRAAAEGAYVTSPAELELLPGAADAVHALNRAGVAVAVVTNQRCVALGLLEEERLADIHERLREQLDRASGARLDAVYHCPHDNGACACRKPAPGMLAAAARDFGVRPEETVMIGDADSDVEAGRRFGARTIQLTEGASQATLTAPDLRAAVSLVLPP